MRRFGIALIVALLGFQDYAHASIQAYSSRATFNSLGSIAFNSNFQDFGTFFGFPGNPFTRGDVTYNSNQNLTWGSATPYTTTEPLIGNNFWSPILGTIATVPQYSMFGFDIGISTSSTITITLQTNLASYQFPNLVTANTTAGNLDFRGFAVSAGEYFTAFNITADSGSGNLPGITNVAVGRLDGTPGTVPEPSQLIVWGGLAACGAFGLFHRRRK